MRAARTEIGNAHARVLRLRKMFLLYADVLEARAQIGVFGVEAQQALAYRDGDVVGIERALDRENHAPFSSFLPTTTGGLGAP